MANDTTITIIGNISREVEMRFTPGGDAVANFTVASTPQSFDKQSQSWKDGETLFMRCAAWRELAENVTESLTLGTRVLVTGRLKSRSYEKDGQKRTALELEVDEIGPSLRYANAKVTRTQRKGDGGGYGNQPQPAQQSQPATTAGGWGGNAGGWGTAPAPTEPPF